MSVRMIGCSNPRREVVEGINNESLQQQPDPACCWSDSLLPGVIVEDLPAAGVDVEPILDL